MSFKADRIPGTMTNGEIVTLAAMISEVEPYSTEVVICVTMTHISRHEHELVVTSNAHECPEAVHALLALAIKTGEHLPNVDSGQSGGDSKVTRYCTRLRTSWSPFHR